ncbi:MAG: hypothetical protein PHS96_01990 [Anaerolineales bacterium]|nr:hypothetical protein [Anaerolineales bacterium]
MALPSFDLAMTCGRAATARWASECKRAVISRQGDFVLLTTCFDRDDGEAGQAYKEYCASTEHHALTRGDNRDDDHSPTSLACWHGFPPRGVSKKADCHASFHAYIIILQ